ncbi:MAG: transposase [Gammaproteobacteria bacterium]|nr:transposase [Gammaproteobacteria bacterium]
MAVKPTDFRRQIDGLVSHCKHQLRDDPRSGALFVFINRTIVSCITTAQAIG